MNTQYLGEHLGPGRLGHFFIITSFVAALFSAVSYFISARTETKDPTGSNSWRLMGRGGFIVHTVSVVSIFLALYYIIANHLFEYHYAWEHSSLELPGKYLLSCFWEGQEGSFMLWTLWHGILGLIVMRSAKMLETRVMAIIALVQVCLCTMILGIYLTPDIRVGSTPFLLLRQSMQGAPIFSMPNYMSFIKDGSGLNALLQNYWMVIHPPVLFLGFASTLIPFAYCIAALWKKDYVTFIKPTLAWSLFAGGVLGTGIMMGGAWAYESLSFGGYWAWDPVENASLVPWLTLIGGLHTLLVYKSTRRSLPITFVLLLLTNLLVWYSTFLTRTGILGKTSVHAFTGEGQSLYWHILIVIGILLALVLGLLIYRWRSIPKIKTEEDTFSREFWMLIGSIVLLLSSLQIAFATSLPVWAPLVKLITGKEPAPPLEPVIYYNNVQVWVAILLGILSAAVLYMKFRRSDKKVLFSRLLITAVIAGMMALFVGISQKITAWQYDIMLFAACYGIVANIYYAFAVQKVRLKKLGPSIAHFGFAMVLLGILLSSYNKHAISLNTLGVVFDLGKGTEEANAKESRDNMIMYLNTPVAMGDYQATFEGDSASPVDTRTFYKVNFKRIDSATHKVVEQFTLYPDIFENGKGGKKGEKGANPSTKHYWNRDIFTYLNQATDTKITDTSTFKSHLVHQGDTIFLSSGYIIFNGFNMNVHDSRYKPQPNDIAVAAKLDVYDLSGLVQTMQPVYYIRNMYENQLQDSVKSMGVYAKLAKIVPDKKAVEIMIRQTNPKDDYIVLKALVFPFINVLWLGVIVMVLGFFVSLWNLLTRPGKKVEVLGLKQE